MYEASVLHGNISFSLSDWSGVKGRYSKICKSETSRCTNLPAVIIGIIIDLYVPEPEILIRFTVMHAGFWRLVKCSGFYSFTIPKWSYPKIFELNQSEADWVVDDFELEGFFAASRFHNIVMFLTSLYPLPISFDCKARLTIKNYAHYIPIEL